MQISELRQRLSRELQDIPLFDTHEHFIEESDRLKSKSDFFSYLHYVEADLVSSGMRRESSDLSVEEKKKLFFEYWPNVQHTGYGTALKIMAHDLFRVEEITPETFDELNQNAANFPQKGYYQTMLRERANIARSLRIVWSYAPTMCDLDFLYPVPVFDHFATVCSRKDIEGIEKESGQAIHCLRDVEDALTRVFDQREDDGMVGVKIFLAYRRSLDFAQVATAEAKVLFDRAMMNYDDTRVGFEESKPLQDYMIHQIIQNAVERDLPVVIHTGFLNGNWQLIDRTRPTQLTNLFMTYKTGRFVMLHGGWPYSQEFVALAKAFPNVYADMAWTWIVGPGMAERLLGDLLDSVPVNKIFAFGGDYNFAEGAYAHARMARRGIRHVLAERIEHGRMTEEQALDVARMIMNENAGNVFGLNEG
jgi:uncharacterized protein